MLWFQSSPENSHGAVSGCGLWSSFPIILHPVSFKLLYLTGTIKNISDIHSTDRRIDRPTPLMYSLRGIDVRLYSDHSYVPYLNHCIRFTFNVPKPKESVENVASVLKLLKYHRVPH